MIKTKQPIYRWLDSGSDTLYRLLSYFRDKGKRMMLWGAGNRGKIFLQRYDPHAEYFTGVYDMYPEKQGTMLKTGHHVYNPEAVECDIIFVLSNNVERFVRQYIRKHGRSEKIIDIIDIIFGNLSMQEVLNEENIDLTAVRTENICGLVIMYHPKAENFSYARQYAGALDHLVLFDNSPEDNHSLFEQADFPENTEYLWNNGENIGLGEPINRLADLLENSGYSWILTFDQDSLPEENMIPDMRKFINSIQCTDDIAVVSPMLVSDEQEVQSLRNAEFPFYMHTYYIAQSGMLQRISCIHAFGGYDKNLFIDSVDTEFVVRCMQHGYQTIRLNHCFLYHQIEDSNDHEINVNGHVYQTNKYGPLRYYYQYRNALYCRAKYQGSAYEFIWDEGLNGLDKTAALESQSNQILAMINQAKEDFSNHIMGKYHGRTELSVINEIRKI